MIAGLIERLRGIENGNLLPDERTAGEAADAIVLLLGQLDIEEERAALLLERAEAAEARGKDPSARCACSGGQGGGVVARAGGPAFARASTERSNT